MVDEVHVLVRGAFRPLPGATAEKVIANAWTIRIPRSEAVKRLVRSEVTIEAFDKSTFLVGDDESWSAVGERESTDAVWVTALV